MVLVHALRTELYTALGDEARARVWMEAALRWPALNAAPFFRASVRLACAAYYQTFGDPARARQEAEMALTDAEAARSSFTRMEAHRKLGEHVTKKLAPRGTSSTRGTTLLKDGTPFSSLR